MKKCLYCGEELPDRSQFCSRCGRVTRTPGEVATVTTGPPNVCRSCGVVNAKGMTECGSCGAPLGPASSQAYDPALPTVQPPGSTGKTGGICPSCGTVLVGMEDCPKCGWTSEPKMPQGRNQFDSLRIARWLLILSGIAVVASLLISIIYLSDSDRLDDLGAPEELVDTIRGIAACCMTIQIVGAVMAFLTAYMLTRSERRFSLCLVGSAIAIFGIGPYYVASILALIALILIAISGDEFR